MQGKEDIKPYQEYHIAWSDKVNEVIDFANLPWEIVLPNQNVLWGIAKVQYGDNKIVIDLSQLSVITFYGCDSEGNRKKFTAIGYSEDAEAD